MFIEILLYKFKTLIFNIVISIYIYNLSVFGPKQELNEEFCYGFCYISVIFFKDKVNIIMYTPI